MPTATAFVDTSRPQRYIKQAVSHFGNKVTSKLTDEGGRLEFDFGTCDLGVAASAARRQLDAGSLANLQLAAYRIQVRAHLISGRFGIAASQYGEQPPMSGDGSASRLSTPVVPVVGGLHLAEAGEGCL